MTRARGVLAVGIAAAMLAAAPAASAAIDPGRSRRERRPAPSSRASSSPTGRGDDGRLDQRRGACDRMRRLDVRILIERRAEHDQVTEDERSAPVQNCAEGAPTSASSSARRTSAWPARTAGGGRAVRLRDEHAPPGSGLRAIASLFFRERDAC